MRKSYAADACAWLLILLWITLSVCLLLAGDAEMFQRLGAIGIVVGVLYYAVRPPPKVHPDRLLELLQLQDDIVEGLHNLALTANRNVSLLAASIEAEKIAEGAVASPVASALARPILDEIKAKGDANPLRDEREIRAKLTANQLSADAVVERVERIRFLTQSTLVVVGTLQAGFGSLVVPAFGGQP